MRKKSTFRFPVSAFISHKLSLTELSRGTPLELQIELQAHLQDQENTFVGDTGVAAATNIGIDPSDPLYLHPSDNPRAMLVSVPLSGIGYKSWRRSVIRGLSVKNKLGFISGECKPPEPQSQRFRQWVRCDDMVTSWILNSLSKDIADSVKYANNVVELWREFKAVLWAGPSPGPARDRGPNGLVSNGPVSNGAKAHCGPVSTKKPASYYTKLKKLSEELNTLSKKTHYSCTCICGAKENMHKAEQDRRLIQFLMGLNEVYTVVRGSILMMNLLPNIAQALSLLIQDEKQRKIRPNNQMLFESASLSVNTSKHGSYRTNYDANNSSTGGNRPRPFCDYCKKLGRTKDKCYKLHGYP
ncbi:PREDICTED: uncharacterized protein LOC109217656 [Nicotiana attenuata]|uniref:uncharacterized protein LOC109217656 n=1 Tax=Nicotiana attenuata TaxID=49451 RepID=UPI00090573CA|nr:PREDICTED: uncharacterized protein LOC109217656 [Nicotiana attenuata]